jgi:hypothetical protein
MPYLKREKDMWLVGSGEGGARVIIIKWERPKLVDSRANYMYTREIGGPHYLESLSFHKMIVTNYKAHILSSYKRPGTY